MSSRVRARTAATTTALALLLASAAAMPGAQTAASLTLDDAATEQFLRKARVVRTRSAGKGVTGSTRATLSDGTLTHDAQIQSVDESKSQFVTAKGVELNFRDSWTFNIAAYRVDRLIGLNMTPVSVERMWNGKPAAFTWWLDDVMMDEGARLKEKRQPPRTDCWLEQMHQLRMFDALIENTDRNLGNILYTNDWRVWAIDHTRAFRRSSSPPNLADLNRLDRGVFEGLKALEFATLKKEIGRYLTDVEIRRLLSRRDAIVAHFEQRGASALFGRQNVTTECLAR